MTGDGEARSRKVSDLVSAGSDIVGSATGAGFGLMVAGAPGVVTGAAMGSAVAWGLRSAAQELASRVLGPKEKARVGATIEFAAQTIDRRLADGVLPRSDWIGDDSTPTAEEVAEAVLLAAGREPEQRKLQLMGRLLGNLAFANELNEIYAHRLVRLAERLSYSQLNLIALFNLNMRERYPLAEGRAFSGDGSGNRLALLQEIFELHQLTIIQQRATGRSGHDIILNIFTIDLARTQVSTGFGGWLTDLMELPDSIPLEDLKETYKALLGP